MSLKPVPLLNFQINMNTYMYVFVIFSVIAVHQKLSNLAQIAEISLPSVPEVTSEENIYETIEPEDKPIDTDLEVSILLND